MNSLFLILIVLSGVPLVAQRQDLDSNSLETRIYFYVTTVFVKVFSMGLVLPAGSYRRRPWNIFDGLLEIVSGVDLILI